jgi:hypothetical protein
MKAVPTSASRCLRAQSRLDAETYFLGLPGPIPSVWATVPHHSEHFVKASKLTGFVPGPSDPDGIPTDMQPSAIARADGQLMVLAGLCEGFRWHDGTVAGHSPSP